MKTITAEPRRAAFVGFLLILPFIILNAIIGNRIEPFFSLIRPGIHTSPLEYVLLASVLLLLPLGAFIALRPMLRKGANESRRFYLLNGVVAALLLTAFAALCVGLGVELYRCDILRIANCD